MSELPTGWEETRLGDIVELKYGSSLPEKSRVSGPFQVFGSNGPVGTHNKSVTDAPAIVVGRKGSIGAVHYTRQECFPIDTTYFVDRFDACEPLFALHLLKSLPLKSMNRATAIPGLNREDAYSLSVCLPPLAEQRRIAAQIDSLSDKSGRARDHLDHLPRLVEKYKQAVLAAAFRGDLTTQWRATHPKQLDGTRFRQELLRRRKAVEPNKKNLDIDFGGERILPELPSTWTWMPVAGIAVTVADGVHKKPDYVEEGVPFLTVRNLTGGPGLSFSGCRYVTQADHQEFIKRTHPERGDILISKDGTLGVIRAVRTDQPFSIFVSVALVKPCDREITDYLELAFQAPVVQGQMVGVGSGLQHVHLADLRRDLIPIAPPEEQGRIVCEVQRLFSWIDRLSGEARRASTLVDHLDDAVLAKAFRGELVPQDPNDEPASVLLERIRAERATSARSTGAPRSQRRTGRRGSISSPMRH